MTTPSGSTQSDYDKLRRMPYLYTFNILNMAALVCTVNAPLALYAAELGIEKGRIGILAGLMPFMQVLCIAFLPIVMAYSQRLVTGAAYASRYLFIFPWMVAPWLAEPDKIFWLLFACMTGFSICRTLAETAIWLGRRNSCRARCGAGSAASYRWRCCPWRWAVRSSSSCGWTAARGSTALRRSLSSARCAVWSACWP